MTYKYKDDVKRVLFEQQRVEQNPSVLNTAFNMRDELNEVYRKAKAFDEIMSVYESNSSSTDDILEAVENAQIEIENEEPE
ncbi:hypothetical protein [Salinicoccus roseus]|uniref:Uncharacterized protein n=1 Tax=Salinicoccus roseus TaxID=45670 RepID=A0A265E699_9STAP|nr:hypothetical protein [Salinicoccus roseus]OZT77127.1 hypothetical protein CFN03_08610 [Salinicoccus roseus]